MAAGGLFENRDSIIRRRMSKNWCLSMIPCGDLFQRRCVLIKRTIVILKKFPAVARIGLDDLVTRGRKTKGSSLIQLRIGIRTEKERMNANYRFQIADGNESEFK